MLVCNCQFSVVFQRIWKCFSWGLLGIFCAVVLSAGNHVSFYGIADCHGSACQATPLKCMADKPASSQIQVVFAVYMAPNAIT